MLTIKLSTYKKLFLVLLIFGTISEADSNETCNEISTAFNEKFYYYDRNGDGKVDFERHIYLCLADADWELRDDNYDGRYETKLTYGFGPSSLKVDLPIPKEVTIELKEEVPRTKQN